MRVRVRSGLEVNHKKRKYVNDFVSKTVSLFREIGTNVGRRFAIIGETLNIGCILLLLLFRLLFLVLLAHALSFPCKFRRARRICHSEARKDRAPFCRSRAWSRRRRWAPSRRFYASQLPPFRCEGARRGKWLEDGKEGITIE